MTLTITAVPDSSSDSPRVRLDVDSTTSGPLPIPGGAPVGVVRVHSDGSRWPVLLENGARLGGGSWAGFDYHAPFNQLVTYVAQAAGFESAASGVVELPNGSTTWLIHASTPELSLIPEMVTVIGDQDYESDADTFDVFNSPFPVTVSSGFRKSAASTIELLVLPSQVGAVLALLADSGPILINTPGTEGWDVTWAWAQPGAVKISNPAPANYVVGATKYPYRKVSFAFRHIGAPDIDVTPVWTCADVVATYATCAAVVAAYSTCENLALDVRS